MMEFNIDGSIYSWVTFFNEKCADKDLLIFFDNDDDSIWFASNFGQKISVLGGSEVVIICGEIIDNIKQFSAQVNVCLPCGYRMSPDENALYDTLLNFESEPASRVLIWSDAQHLLKKDSSEFELIFELMVQSAFINRTGRGTVKEDGSLYQVNQRNVFVFVGINVEDLSSLLTKEYLVNVSAKSTDYEKVKMDFEIVRVPSDSVQSDKK